MSRSPKHSSNLLVWKIRRILWTTWCNQEAQSQASLTRQVSSTSSANSLQRSKVVREISVVSSWRISPGERKRKQLRPSKASQSPQIKSLTLGKSITITTISTTSSSKTLPVFYSHRQLRWSTTSNIKYLMLPKLKRRSQRFNLPRQLNAYIVSPRAPRIAWRKKLQLGQVLKNNRKTAILPALSRNKSKRSRKFSKLVIYMMRSIEVAKCVAVQLLDLV